MTEQLDRASIDHGPVWPVLTDATRSALREILVHGVLSRAEIARSLGLSRASLTRAVRTLQEHGFVIEVGTGVRGATGRPSELLRTSEGVWEFVGVKLTQDRLYAAVTDLAGRVLALHEELLRDASPDALVRQVGEVVDRLRAASPAICALGVSVPGDVVTRDGVTVVEVSQFLGWRDVPLSDMLERRTGLVTFAANDVDALTAKEHWIGAGAGVGSMALVTVGAGVGFGLVSNGEVSEGAHGRFGRVGHLPVYGGGPDCGVGHAGCVSSYLPSSIVARNAGHEDAGYDAVVDLARAGDEQSLQALRDAGTALGVLLSTVVTLVDPESIVLTGDGLPVYDLARAEVDAAFAHGLRPYEPAVTVVVQPFEFSEWARAAAVLAVRRLLRF
ncbi:ROK family transcriptional regulator [Curtobacterium sp. A7_M15]|uniref:ROK family transcriptional regulator n=1 Tax=Curtobacterium sp. A7_M15 TaxID=3065241 RepID=UPI002737EB01|nr:ROK family transcriptional regulator [Curtobacterium sp. A7_M15]MDP4332165.1 ROK family transcriptional regulator [Curtobacterium sp. A7_M15]